MRAYEFVNEGLWDTIKQKAGQARSDISNAANIMGKDLRTAAKTVSNSNLAKAAKTVGSNLFSWDPSLKRSTAKRSSEIFKKEFLETLKATQIQQQKLGKEFTLPKFVNAYMTRYGWTPGEYQSQLQQVINDNDIDKLAVVMDKIGIVNAEEKRSVEKAINLDPEEIPTNIGQTQNSRQSLSQKLATRGAGQNNYSNIQQRNPASTMRQSRTLH